VTFSLASENPRQQAEEASYAKQHGVQEGKSTIEGHSHKQVSQYIIYVSHHIAYSRIGYSSSDIFINAEQMVRYGEKNSHQKKMYMQYVLQQNILGRCIGV
jgi:hypothetical protein